MWHVHPRSPPRSQAATTPTQARALLPVSLSRCENELGHNGVRCLANDVYDFVIVFQHRVNERRLHCPQLRIRVVYLI